jgi:YidC/Oxa1 family membrane protein insertase
MSFLAEYNIAKKLTAEYHPIIIYSENRYYYQYFQQLVQDVFQQSNLPILYITSDKQDPLLKESHQRMRVVFINLLLAWIFPRLNGGVMLLTMPDLNNYQYKKSAKISSFIYVFHAAVSIHQQYNDKAFFHYDAFFCTGTYQVKELAALQKIHGLPEKKLLPYGYPLIDSIKSKFEKNRKLEPAQSEKQLLIAPSWYPGCILETCIEALLEQFVHLPYTIIIRPHPEYVKRKKKRYLQLKKMAALMEHVFFDESSNVLPQLIKANLLITDRSGIALEYAFGTYRPVLFIDTPPKITNLNWQQLRLEPIENSIRKQIGNTISPINIHTIGEAIDDIIEKSLHFADQIKKLEKELLFNSPETYQSGTSYIISKAGLPK